MSGLVDINSIDKRLLSDSDLKKAATGVGGNFLRDDLMTNPDICGGKSLAGLKPTHYPLMKITEDAPLGLAAKLDATGRTAAIIKKVDARDRSKTAVSQKVSLMLMNR